MGPRQRTRGPQLRHGADRQDVHVGGHCGREEVGTELSKLLKLLKLSKLLNKLNTDRFVNIEARERFSELLLINI